MAATQDYFPQTAAAAALAANASIPSHLHPVALRSTTHATSSRAHAASMLAEAQLRGHPADLENALPRPPVPPKLAARSPAPPPPPTCALPPLPDAAHLATLPSSPRIAKSPMLSPRGSSLSRPGLSRQATPRKETKVPPVAGLQVDHSRFPFLTIRASDSDDGHSSASSYRSSSTPSPPPQDRHTAIRLITADELAELQRSYNNSSSIADESLMFPWLHCCDQAGTPQANYFCAAQGSRAATVPRYRGLTLVSADAEDAPCQRRVLNRGGGSLRERILKTRHERGRTHSLGSSSTASSASLESAVSSLFDNALSIGGAGDLTPSTSTDAPPTSPSCLSDLIGNEPRASLLTSSLFPEDFLATDARSGALLPQFVTPRLPANVNLRLFKHQPARYASVSDVVVYSENGLCEDAVALAETVQAAQERVRRERERVALEEGAHPSAGGVVEYVTYVVTDRFEEFEKRHGGLVAVDGWGFRRNRVDFFEREREEMVALTKASEIAKNVWLGNSNDVPMPSNDDAHNPFNHGLSTSDSSSSLATTVTTVDDGNVNAFAICLEAHDGAVMPAPDMLLAHEAHFESVERDLPHFPSSPPASTPIHWATEPYADLRPSVHCGDGEGGRVLRPHVADVAHLEVVSTAQICGSQGQVEALVERMVELCAWVGKMAKPEDEGKLGKRVLIYCHDGYTESSLFALAYTMWDRACSLPEAYLHLQLARDRSFFVYPADVPLLMRIEARMQPLLAERRDGGGGDRMDVDPPSRSSSPLPPPTPRGFLRNRYSFGLSGRHSVPATPPPSPAPVLTPKELHPWFYDDRFDGHFPSRILPFLYLGNLNHASNALMLRALGITHVVSMGESALVPPKSATFPLSLSSPTRARSGGAGVGPTNSLWHEHKAGRIQVLDMKNVADDGIDSIRPHIDRAMAFIEDARLSGGKVLVHCRVGVSRSATIVIAYVMRHLKMDLASAYLMVRSRRLNILIQPNLLFMWALRKLEADLVEQEEDPAARVRRAEKQLAWSHFSREVAALNTRYLC